MCGPRFSLTMEKSSSTRSLKVVSPLTGMSNCDSLSDEEVKHRSSKRKVRNRGKASSASVKRDRTFVDHSYHDHLYDPVTKWPSMASANCDTTPSYHTSQSLGGETRPTCKTPKGGLTVQFPTKLYAMLQSLEEENLDHIASWQPHGRCFIIHKKSVFVEQIMPRFFQQSKLTSFQRQLNLYGFLRLTAGRDRGSYYHELFLRGREDLTHRMNRIRVKGNGMKAASSPSTEPNFYQMDHCPKCGTQPENLLRPGRPQGNQYGFASDDDDDACTECDEDEAAMVPDLAISLQMVSPQPADPAVVSPFPSPYQSRQMVMHEDLDPLSLDSFPPLVNKGETSSMVECSEDREISSSFPAEPDDFVSLLYVVPEYEEVSRPRTGDPVLFEGLQFRYLEHWDYVAEGST